MSTGYLYDSERDRYFSDMSEALDWYDSHGHERPEHLTECEQRCMRIDANAVVHDALEEFHEGAEFEITDAEMRRLQAFLTLWCATQGVCSWFPTSTLVPVPRGGK